MIYDEKGINEEDEIAFRERERSRVAQEVMLDFNRRREERRSVESGWLLNLNFLSGNQYCDVSPLGDIVEEDQRFYWQSRRVFNHIAPMMDARITTLEKLKPDLVVRAFSDEEGDIKAAKLATGILKYVQGRIGLNDLISRATVWSETCGTSFYKVGWNEKGGRQVGVDEAGEAVFEGEVQVSVVPPFELFPDRLDAENLNDLTSLIHARAVPVGYIEEQFGVSMHGEEISQLQAYSEPSAGKLPTQVQNGRFATVKDAVILIERYTRPCVGAPQGKLEIVAGGKLLYEGELPFINGERNERGFPFVKQDSMPLPGAFFSSSVIDRLIPVQRAYNAVRNRKHEFLNRLSMGVLTVEDGSIDTDELSEEGLIPGKVLVYRQGGKAPEMLDCGSVPNEFKEEEDRLQKEFSLISGVKDLAENSALTRVTSATGLQLLLAQDESRLTPSIRSIEEARREIGRQILRLYRQFAGTARLMTLTGENKKTQVHYFNASNLNVSDLQFEDRQASTPEEKKATLLKLYEAGLLTDENGKLTAENKHRILDAFGFGGYENARDISALHIAKASEENLDLKSQDIAPDAYDDHALHILEHTRFLLSHEFKKIKDKESVKKRFEAHMAAHKKLKKEDGREGESLAVQEDKGGNI